MYLDSYSKLLDSEDSIIYSPEFGISILFWLLKVLKNHELHFEAFRRLMSWACQIKKLTKNERRLATNEESHDIWWTNVQSSVRYLEWLLLTCISGP